MSGYRPGRRIRHYEIVDEIARGATSTVYVATDTHLDTTVAIKQLIQPHIPDPTLGPRFEAEAKVAASIRHPNVVEVYDHFIHRGDPLIVMEFFPLGTARALIGSLEIDEIVTALAAILSGLEAAQARDVIHRDIKPENLMRTDHGSLKVADFGIAKTYATDALHLTPLGERLGSLYYMAPELLDGFEAAPQVDIYAVGAVAYELIAGSPPYADDQANAEAIRKRKERMEPRPIEAIRPQLDARLAKVVRRLMKRDPRERPATAAEALVLLDAAVQEIGLVPGKLPIRVSTTPSTPSIPGESRFAPWHRLVAIAPPARLVGHAATKPQFLIVTAVMVIAALAFGEWLLGLGAVVAGGALYLMTLFDEAEAMKARPTGARRPR